MSDPYKFKNMLSCDCLRREIGALLQCCRMAIGFPAMVAPQPQTVLVFALTVVTQGERVGTCSGLTHWYFCSSSFSTCSETGFVCHEVRVWI